MASEFDDLIPGGTPSGVDLAMAATGIAPPQRARNPGADLLASATASVSRAAPRGGRFDDLVPAPRGALAGSVMAPASEAKTTIGEDINDIALAIRTGAYGVTSSLAGLPVNIANAALHNPTQRLVEAGGRAVGLNPAQMPYIEQPQVVRDYRADTAATIDQENQDYASEKLLRQRAELAGDGSLLGTIQQLMTNPTALADVAAQQVAQAPLMLAGGSSVLGRTLAGGVTAGGMAADQVAQDLAQRQDLTPQQRAEREASAFAASTAMNSALPFLPGGQTIERASVPGARQSIGSLLEAAVRGGVGEGAQGALSEAGDQGIQNLATDKPVGQGMGQAAALGALLEGPLGAGAGAIENVAAQGDAAQRQQQEQQLGELARAVLGQPQQAAAEAPAAAALPQAISQVVEQLRAQPAPAAEQAPAPAPARAPTESAQIIDDRLAELQRLSNEGDLGDEEFKALTRRDAQIRRLLAREESLARTGTVRADPGQAPDREALAREQADIKQRQERQRTARGYSYELERLQQRLAKVDSDAGLQSVAEQLRPLPAPSQDSQAAPRAEPQVLASAAAGVTPPASLAVQQQETNTTPQEVPRGPAEAEKGTIQETPKAPPQGSAAESNAAPELAPRLPPAEPMPQGMDLAGAREAYRAAQTPDTRARAAGWIAQLQGQRAPAASRAAPEPARAQGLRQGQADPDISASLGRAAAGVSIASTIDDVPQSVRDRYSLGGDNADVEGFYDQESGISYVIESNLDTKRMPARERKVWVAAHERSLHAGLRGLIADRTDSAGQARSQLASVLGRAEQNPTVKAIAQEMRRQRPQDADMAVEEVLAELAAAVRTGNYGAIEERYGVAVPPAARAGIRGYIQRLIQAIRAHLGLGDKVSDRDIYQLIEDAHQFASRGQVQGTRGSARDEMVAQRTFHGTPTRGIERLSTDFMGKGEGQQTYGWGVYTAEERQVADNYRQGLSAVGRTPGGRLADDLLQRTGSRREAVELVARMRRAGPSSAERMLGKVRWTTSGDPNTAQRAMERELNEAERFIRADNNRGALYQQEVPDAHEVLDWDAPLSEQPEQVRRALRSVEGGPLYRDTMQPFEDPKGSAIYQALSSDLGGDRQASEALGAAGVPGLRYLDGDSRRGRSGTYNHVTWDNSRIEPSEAIIASRREQEATPEFRRWFGDSKVVDASGNPLVVYHGSPDARFMDGDAVFKNIAERYGQESDQRAFWFAADPATAATYADDRRAFDYQNAESGVVPAYLRLEDPLEVDGMGREWRDAQARGKTSDVIQQAREEGRDGVIIRNVRDDYNGYGRGSKARATDTYVVFSSNQIKSADRNSGEFDPENPSVVASRITPQQRAQLRQQTMSKLNAMGYASGSATQNPNTGRFQAIGEAVDLIRTSMQDRMLPILRAQERAGAGPVDRGVSSINLSDALNTYRLENLLHGKVKEQVDRVNREIVLPAQQMMKRLGVTPEMVQDVMLATHAPERNAKVASINGMQDGAAGITTAEAAEILAGTRDGPFSGKKLSPGQIASANRVRALLARARDITLSNMVEAGQITPAQRQQLESTYSEYVPLRGQNGNPFEDEIGGGGAGRGITVAKSRIKRALGRGAGNLPKNILGEIVGDVQRSIVVREKARVARSFLAFAMAHPDPDLYSVEPVDLEWKYSEVTGEAYLGVRNSAEDVDRSIVVRHNGEPVRIRFEDPALRDAVMNMGVEDVGALVRYVGVINRWRSAVLTRFNPAFTPINVMRDLQFGIVGIAGERGNARAARALADYLPAMRAMYRSADGRRRGNAAVPNAQKSWDDWADEAAMAGMKTGVSQVDEVKDLQRRMSIASTTLMQLAASGRYVRATAEAVRRPLTELGNVIERVNDATENALRLAAYVGERKTGASPDRAAEYAKNLTINFNRRGKLGPALNSIYLFYNASVQGSHAVFRVMRSPKAQAFVGALAMLQAYMAEQMMDDDDEDGVSTWDTVPDYVKRTSLVIPIAALTGNKRDYFALPMPYGFNVFPYMGGRLMQRYKQGSRETDKPVVSDMLKSTTEAFSPLPLFEDYQSLFGDQFALAFQLAGNRDDIGRPITKESAYSDYEVPRAMLGQADTARPYHVAAQLLAKLGGGNLAERKPPVGYLDVSPEQLETVVNYMGGGLSNLASKGLKWYEQMEAGNQQDAFESAASLPVVSRLIGRASDARAIAERYYGERGLLSRKQDVLQDKIRAGADPDAAIAEAAKDPTMTGLSVSRYKRKTERPNGATFAKGDAKRTATGGVQLQAEDLSPIDMMKMSEKALKDYNASIRRLRGDSLTNADVVDLVGSYNAGTLNYTSLGLPQGYDAAAKAPPRVRNRAIKLMQDMRAAAQKDTLQTIESRRKSAKAGD